MRTRLIQFRDGCVLALVAAGVGAGAMTVAGCLVAAVYGAGWALTQVGPWLEARGWLE